MAVSLKFNSEFALKIATKCLLNLKPALKKNVCRETESCLNRLAKPP